MLIFIVISIFSVLYSALSLLRHLHFQSGAFDLGIYDQAVWQYSQFLWPFNTIKMMTIWGDHLTLTLPLLAPLYWLWQDARMLLIFQAVWVSLSGLAIYKYVIKRGLSECEALVLSAIYLLFSGIQFAIFFDFHPVVIGVGLLTWLLYFWETEKWKLFAVITILLLLTQENMGMALFGVSLIWFFQRKRLKLAIFLALLGLLYSFASFKIISLLSPIGLQYQPNFPLDLTGFITGFFDSPDKRQVWLFSYSWYSFLPIFSLGSVLAVVSDLAQYFLTGSEFGRMWSPYMHHRAILSVYLLAGAVEVLVFLKSKKINTEIIVILMIIFSLFFQYRFHFALNKLIKPEFWQSEQWVNDNYKMLKNVPKSASIAAQQSLVPHLSHRQYIYLLYPRLKSFSKTQVCSQELCWWLDFSGQPEFMAVDLHKDEWLTMTLADSKDFRQAVENMEKAGAIKLVYKKGEARIYRINYTNLRKVI